MRNDKPFAAAEEISWNPLAAYGAGWNPLREIRAGTGLAYPDSALVAQVLLDPQGRGLEDRHDDMASSLLAGMVVFETYRAKHEREAIQLADIHALLTKDEDRLERTLRAMATAQAHAIPGPGIASRVASIGRQQLRLEPSRRRTVMLTASDALGIFLDPRLIESAERGGITLRKMALQDSVIRIRTHVDPVDEAWLHPFTRLFQVLAQDAAEEQERKCRVEGLTIIMGTRRDG